MFFCHFLYKTNWETYGKKYIQLTKQPLTQRTLKNACVDNCNACILNKFMIWL